MSVLSKINRKLKANSQPIVAIAIRFFSTDISTKTNPRPFPNKPTAAYYDELINEAGSSGNFDTVRDLLNKRMKDGCFNTTDTFKFIINTERSIAVLNELSQTLARLNGGITRKDAYDSLIARLCKLGRIEESLRTIDMMLLGECRINACTFHPILNALSRKRKMKEAWGVINLMKEIGLPPDRTAYNYLLTAYCMIKDLPEAANVLVKMSEEGMDGDNRTYDAMVLGACRAGKVEGALMVLRAMEEEGVSALYSTHSHVVNALLRMGFYVQAVEFVLSYGGRDMGLDTESFGVLARRLIKLGRNEEAKLVVEEMKSRGLAMGTKLDEFHQWNVKNQ